MMSDDGFIGLPPGILPAHPDTDSGTVRRERPERARTERPEIVFFPVGAAPVAEVPVVAAPVVAAPPAPELDDATRVSPPKHGAAAWRLSIPGHEQLVVSGQLFLGRNPVATPGYPAAAVVAVDDEAKSVSKTHALLEVDAGALWVHDLDSTNGVWVVPAGGEAIEVTPGTRVAVPAGADLEIGDVVIGVEHG